MTWEIYPLQGKYYGTIVGNGKSHIEVWTGFNGTFQVSEREIELGWDEEYGYDHIESQRDYDIAQIICNALNEKKIA